MKSQFLKKTAMKNVLNNKEEAKILKKIIFPW